ncbi:MAG: hypothetical protein CVU41_07640 [Chloroflexi bacterium HGW-Chloroflexi-3]|nr:MAG: hypothetical protein CVU41_07640 [Chloroflexi bacterium HGW-Chloroflexi-3]
MHSKFQKSIVLPDLTDKHQLTRIGMLNSARGKITSFDHTEKSSLLAEIHTSGLNCVWINLDADDRDQGRFWLKFVAGLRKFHPDIGKELIGSLLDHHSQPLKPVLLTLTHELDQQEILVVLENVQFLSGQTWWKFVQEWLNQSLTMKWIGLQADHQDNSISELNGLEGVNADQYANLSTRLIGDQEWLEYLHILLSKKEFELAGELLEEKGETWLEKGFDPLELLFWLREIPSVLLNARPVLCWLGAKACHSLELPLLVNYYSNAAEHSLSSLSRFSRNQDEWFTIEINEGGMTVGELLEKINQLKQ